MKKDLSGGVKKSNETRWQNGKDIPEGESLTGHTSGTKVSRTQRCEGSVSPAQKIARCIRRDFKICPDHECALDGGGTFIGTFCDRCGRDVVVSKP